MQINWINFDGALFQELCNSIILFEVSKRAHVYSAPGKDGGIDQYFEGEYEGKSGKWRFQDKFHSDQLSKDKQIIAFKQDIKNDIQAHFNHENYIIFITNINLLPQEENLLIKIAKDEIEELKYKIIDIFIWHQAKIDALITQYPLIYYKYWEYRSLLLENYQDYFKVQLDKNNLDLRFQLNNKFFGRDKELKVLEAFINDKSNSTIIIIGEGGYGKTRLCIEFFQKYIDKYNDWVPLVFNKNFSDLTSFMYQLEGNKKYLILIDDVVDISDPNIINEIKKYADNHVGRIKLIFTIRENLIDIFYRILSSYNKGKIYNIIKLAKLEYNETFNVFKSQLSLDNRHLNILSQASKGIPNLILELCHTIREGKHPTQVNEQENFITNVKKIVDEAIEDVYNQTYIDKSKINNIIKYISLLAPILYDKKELELISNLIEINFTEFSDVLIRLQNNKLITGKFTISITPDSYSDVVLKNNLSSNIWIQEFLNKPESDKYLSNIIKNLSKNETNNEYNYSEKLLDDYIIKLTDKTIKSNEFSQILKTVEKVANYKPQISIKAINSFINIYANKNHPLHKYIEFYDSKYFLEEKIETLNKIFEILIINTTSPIELSLRFQILENFVKVTNDYKALTYSFRYREFDFKNANCAGNYCCVRQQFLKSKAIEYLNTDDVFKQNLGFTCGEILLSYELSLEEYYVPQTNLFHYGRGLVPLCEHTKEIRNNIIKAYIEFYNSDFINEEIKNKIFNSLLEILRFIRQPEKGKYEYDHSEEINTVFEFLNSTLDAGLNIILKNKIIYEIELVIKKDYKKEYDKQMENTKDKASKVDTIKEGLYMLMLGGHIFKPRTYFNDELIKIINEYKDFKKFQEDFIEIHKNFDAIPYYYATLTFEIIAQSFPDNAKEMFNFLFNNYIQYIYEFRILIRAIFKDEQYFYNIINKLRDSEIKNKYEHIAWFLTLGRNDKKYFKERDFEYWDDMVYNHLNEVIETLPYTLIDYLEINKGKTFNLLKYVFDNFEHPRQIEMMLLSLIDDKKRYDENKKYEDEFENEIKELIINHTQKFPLGNSYFNYAFAFLENHFGFDTLFKFLINRIESYEKDSNNLYYLSFSGMHYGNRQSSEGKSISNFIKVFKWYIQVEDDKYHIKKSLLEFFKPTIVFNEAIKKQIDILIEENKTNPNSLIKIGSGLEIFKNKNEILIITLIKISDYYLDISNRDVKNLDDIFGFDILTGPSSVSKHQPGPFPQDVERKELLEKIISYDMKSETKNILEIGLKNTQQRIDAEITEAKNNW